MMKTASVGLAIGFAAALSACGVKSATTDLNPRFSRPASCEAVIQTYASRAEIPSDYYELAWISAEGNSIYTTDNQLRTEIKKEAAKVGATAVIVNPVSEAKQGVKVLGEAIGANSATARATALAVYLPADDARLTQFCGTR